MPYIIEHDRPNCIGCAACAAIAPQFWEMMADDGKSDLRDSKKIIKNTEIIKEELEVPETGINKDAAEACPVNVIHIIRKETGEKII